MDLSMISKTVCFIKQTEAYKTAGDGEFAVWCECHRSDEFGQFIPEGDLFIWYAPEAEFAIQ